MNRLLISSAALALFTSACAMAQETTPREDEKATRIAADFAVQRPSEIRMTPENSILVYVDYTTGLDNLMNTLPTDVYKNNIEAFAKLNPLFGIPAVVMGTENAYYGTMLPEITDHVTHDVHQFPRHTSSGYTAEFAEWLEASGRKKVIIGGISIDNCTMHTSLDLLNAGYDVYVVADVSSTNSRLVEDVALSRLQNEGATIVTWLYVMTELGQSWELEYGDGMRAIVRDHWPQSTVGETEDSTPDGAGLGNFGMAGREE